VNGKGWGAAERPSPLPDHPDAVLSTSYNYTLPATAVGNHNSVGGRDARSARDPLTRIGSPRSRGRR